MCIRDRQWDAPSPLKFAPSQWGIWTPSNTWFPGPTRVLNPNGISIGSAVFVWLTSDFSNFTSHRPYYCYRPSGVVRRLVCRSVTLVSPAKTAESIEMPFGLRTRVGPGTHVLDESPDPPWERAILRGKGPPIVKYRDTLR